MIGCCALWTSASNAQPASFKPGTNEIRIVELQGEVEVSPAGATTWVLTRTNQVLHPLDRVRSGVKSRFALRWSDQSVVSFGASTELEILPPDRPDAQSGLHLVRGLLSFFHRDEPGRIRVITRGAVAGVEGTEFVVAVDTLNGAERTILSVIDGTVRFGNEQSTLVLTNGQQAIAEPGKAPVRTAGFVANNLLQWCFYYPAVLDLADLPLTSEEQTALKESLEAYRAGDLLAALAKYPASGGAASDPERVYQAALLLSVGQVEKAETALASLSASDNSARLQRLSAALHQLVCAVKRQPNPSPFSPQLPTECLAGSYYEQSRALPGVSLKTALALARRAATNSPGFGFAWERVAELEFGFGRTREAMDALDKSLDLAPRNAQSLALKGFLLAAENRARAAIPWFDRALAADSSLGNAWLGRGLCRIRLGEMKDGRDDLLVAAALEPQRAELRSYLGKAYGDAGQYPQAKKELKLARNLDPGDPTPWLYSALLNQEHNRVNEAIRDLEKSQELNDNRSVYRSQLLLDQDHAVRSANLAAMYRDAGMFDVALREASRSVNYDYANYSAHLFLANSYNQYRNPNLFNLRYETPRETEYLIANLLAPVSAGPVSPTVSQQEYSRLFERDRVGVVSSTEYGSRGAWTQSGAQYGTFGTFSYDVEAFYQFDPGQRLNNDSEQRQLQVALKQQITPQDTVTLRVQHYEGEYGNLFQYYDPNSTDAKRAEAGYRINEKQEPIVDLGYHHEWSPGVHTLFFVTRLDDNYSLTNPFAPTLLTFRPEIDPGLPTLIAVHQTWLHERYTADVDIYSGELQQLWQLPSHTTILGARAQYGHFRVTDREIDPYPPYASYFDAPPKPAAQTNINPLLKRFSVYGYHQWQILDPLQLIGGLTYDRLTYPETFQTAPVTDHETTADRVSPKAGLVWTPAKDTTARFAYTRSMGGASMDQSTRLEPSQVAGFNQAFRSVIPESVAGPIPGARFETYDISLEQKLRTGTYLGVSGELLNSTATRYLGAFDSLDQFDFAVPSLLRQDLDYSEQSLLLTANQLVAHEWSFGARYRLSSAVLKENLVNVPDHLPFNNADSPRPRVRLEGVLHQVDLLANYNHPSGFFAQCEAVWYAQSNTGYAPPGEPGDDFWQFNLFAGYRFPRRMAEVTLSLLNITGQDYKLDPLNLHSDLPRSRTLALSLRLSF
jgi:Tfp pilus assembly protein PilF